MRRTFLYILILVFCTTYFTLLNSCSQRKLKLDLKEGRLVHTIFVNIENLAGDLRIDRSRRYLYEIKEKGILGVINSRIDGDRLGLLLQNISGECWLYLHKSREIELESLIANGILRLNASFLNIKRFKAQINGGEAKLIFGHNVGEVIITNDFGDLDIRVTRDIGVKLKLISMASSIELPEDFIFSNNFYFLNYDALDTVEMDVVVNFGSFRFSFY